MTEVMNRRYMELFTTSEQLYRGQDYSSSFEVSPHSSYRHSSPSPGAGAHRSVMNDSDKTIYNSLGSTSSPAGKLTYKELSLNRGWQKRGTMWKTGPNPAWYSVWNKRLFVLKGNFIYYLALQSKIEESKVLGAIYLKNSVVEKVSLPLAKLVIKITPPVPRRPNCSDDDSAIFHIKFKSEEGRNEWFEDLQQVAFSNKFPEERRAVIDTSGAFR